MASVAERVEPIELGKHLRRSFGARQSSIQFDNIAELTGERTAARILHANVEIMFKLEQIEARDRARGHISLELGCGERAGTLAGIPGGDEVIDRAFGFTQHQKIGAL